MERTKWTDDLLDQRFATMDEKFELLFSEIRLLREEMRAGFAELRKEMHAGFAALRGEITGLRSELVTQMAVDRAQVVAMHRQMNRMLATALVAVVGLLGVLVAKI
jgi:hypothetical protein